MLSMIFIPDLVELINKQWYDCDNGLYITGIVTYHKSHYHLLRGTYEREYSDLTGFGSYLFTNYIKFHY